MLLVRQNKNACAGEQDLENLDALLLGYRQLIDPGQWIDTESPSFGRSGLDLLGGFAADVCGNWGLVCAQAQQYVFRNTERVLNSVLNVLDAPCHPWFDASKWPIQTYQVVNWNEAADPSPVP